VTPQHGDSTIDGQPQDGMHEQRESSGELCDAPPARKPSELKLGAAALSKAGVAVLIYACPTNVDRRCRWL
jgi:hypothetical protein